MTPILPSRKRKRSSYAQNIAQPIVATTSVTQSVALSTIHETCQQPEQSQPNPQIGTKNHRFLNRSLSEEEINKLKYLTHSVSLEINEISLARFTFIKNGINKPAIRGIFRRMKDSVLQSTTMSPETKQQYLEAILQSGKEAKKTPSISKQQHTSEFHDVLKRIKTNTLPLDNVQQAFQIIDKECSYESMMKHMLLLKKNLLSNASTDEETQQVLSCFSLVNQRYSTEETNQKRSQLREKILSCNFEPEEGCEIIQQLIDLNTPLGTIKSWKTDLKKSLQQQGWTPKHSAMFDSLHCTQASYQSATAVPKPPIKNIKSNIRNGIITKEDILPYRLRLIDAKESKPYISTLFSLCKSTISSSNRSEEQKKELIEEIERSSIETKYIHHCTTAQSTKNTLSTSGDGLEAVNAPQHSPIQTIYNISHILSPTTLITFPDTETSTYLQDTSEITITDEQPSTSQARAEDQLLKTTVHHQITYTNPSSRKQKKRTRTQSTNNSLNTSGYVLETVNAPQHSPIHTIDTNTLNLSCLNEHRTVSSMIPVTCEIEQTPKTIDNTPNILSPTTLSDTETSTYLQDPSKTISDEHSSKPQTIAEDTIQILIPTSSEEALPERTEPSTSTSTTVDIENSNITIEDVLSIIDTDTASTEQSSPTHTHLPSITIDIEQESDISMEDVLSIIYTDTTSTEQSSPTHTHLSSVTIDIEQESDISMEDVLSIIDTDTTSTEQSSPTHIHISSVTIDIEQESDISDDFLDIFDTTRNTHPLDENWLSCIQNNPPSCTTQPNTQSTHLVEFTEYQQLQESELHLGNIQNGYISPINLVESIRSLLKTTHTDELLEALSLYEINHLYDPESASAQLALAERIIKAHKNN